MDNFSSLKFALASIIFLFSCGNSYAISLFPFEVPLPELRDFDERGETGDLPTLDGGLGGASSDNSNANDDDYEQGGYWGFVTGGDLERDPYSDEYPVHRCENCRDFLEFPIDAGNFAWNLVVGPNRSSDNHIVQLIKVENSAGQTVLVWFENYHLAWAPQDEMTIKMELPSGEVVSYSVLVNRGRELPVGIQNESGNGSDHDDASAEEDDYADEDDYEYEPPDRGWPSTEVVDPDDDGNFPEWQREE